MGKFTQALQGSIMLEFRFWFDLRIAAALEPQRREERKEKPNMNLALFASLRFQRFCGRDFVESLTASCFSFIRAHSLA